VFAVLLSALTLSGQCALLSPDPTIRLVQESPAFADALRAIFRREPGFNTADYIASACQGLEPQPLTVLPGVTIVSFDAFRGIELERARFAVYRGRVILLNERPTGRLNGEVSLRQWNRLVQQLPPLPDSLRPRYACLVAGLRFNHGVLDPCNRKVAVIDATDTLFVMGYHVVIDRRGRVLAVSVPRVVPN
jgi:hypothetical protein